MNYLTLSTKDPVTFNPSTLTTLVWWLWSSWLSPHDHKMASTTPGITVSFQCPKQEKRVCRKGGFFFFLGRKNLPIFLRVDHYWLRMGTCLKNKGNPPTSTPTLGDSRVLATRSSSSDFPLHPIDQNGVAASWCQGNGKTYLAKCYRMVMIGSNQTWFIHWA